MHWEDDEDTRDTMMGVTGPTAKEFGELQTYGLSDPRTGTATAI
jgi:hypothetical protein